MTKLTEIEGIGAVCAGKLSGIDVNTVEELLSKGATKKGRGQLAEACELSEKRILRWVNMADLMRIKGVGEEYSDLLEAAGVDTVKELRTRRPDNLTAKMKEVNAEKKLVRQTPTESAVAGWVEQAKALPDVVTHS